MSEEREPTSRGFAGTVRLLFPILSSLVGEDEQANERDEEAGDSAAPADNSTGDNEVDEDEDPSENTYLAILRRYVPTGVSTAFAAVMNIVLNTAKDDEGKIQCKTTHRVLLYIMLGLGLVFSYVITRFESDYVKKARAGFPALTSLIAFGVLGFFEASVVSCLYPKLEMELAVGIPVLVGIFLSLFNALQEGAREGDEKKKKTK